MATVFRKQALSGDNLIQFRASWDLYQALAAAIGDQPVRLAYDGERVELLSPGFDHESYKPLLHRLITGLAEGVGMLCVSQGSTRWVSPSARRGLEADESFYFSEAKITAAKRRPMIGLPPVPDLALEIDISPSKIDGPGIYAALGVPEVWRFDGETLRIDQLTADGSYAAAESGFLGVSPDEVLALLDLEFRDHNDYAKQVRAWATTALRPRRPSWEVP